MPARRTEFSGGTFHRDCLPRSGASRRRSCLLRCGPCRTSRLKFSAAGRPGQRARRSIMIHSPLSPFRHNSRAAPPFSVLLAGPFRAPPGRAAPPFSSLQARPLLSPASHPTGYLSRSSSLAGRKREECPSRQRALSPLFNLFCSAVRYCPTSGGGLRMRAPASGAGSPGSEASTRAACTHLQLAPQCMHALPTGSAYDS